MKLYLAQADETVIYFDSKAQQDFTPDLDAYKIISPDAMQPNLYSMTNNQKYAIHALSTQNEQQVIPLGLKVNSVGNYIIDLSEYANFSATQQIYPVDMLTNTSQDLLINPEYKFTISGDEQRTISEKGRFYITFLQSTTSIISEHSDNMLFYTYANGNTLNVVYQNSSNSDASVSIYNVLGQKVITTQTIESGIHQYKLENGCYIVRLVLITKFILRK